MTIQKRARLHEKTVQKLARLEGGYQAPLSIKDVTSRQKASSRRSRGIEPVDLLQMAVEIIIGEEGSTYTTYEILSPTTARIT